MTCIHRHRRHLAAKAAACVALLGVGIATSVPGVGAQPSLPPAIGAQSTQGTQAQSPLARAAYRRLHEHPELGNKEVETQKYLLTELRRIGYTEFVQSTRAPTAVIAVLDTRRPGPVIALRAEMDARETQEPESHDPRSLVPGVMHNCGHDAHAAMLLGAAEALIKDPRQLSGKIVFLFQPAEETRGGADEIVGEGILARLGVKAIFAQHVVGGAPVGVISVSPGPTMAGSSYFRLTVSGAGAHAAQPHVGSDVLLAGAAMAQGLAGLPARRMDVTTRPAVISPVYFNAGKEGATNVLPTEATIRGTIRAFEPPGGMPGSAIPSIEQIARGYLDGVAKSFGVTYELSITTGSPPTVNDESLFRRMATPLAAAWTSPGHSFDTTPYRGMFSEDFAYYTGAIPALYFGLGIAKDGLGDAGAHTPEFTIHPSALDAGVRFLLLLAETASREVAP